MVVLRAVGILWELPNQQRNKGHFCELVCVRNLNPARLRFLIRTLAGIV